MRLSPPARRILNLAAVLFVLLTVCALTWAAAFWLTGDRVDCRIGATSFCALRTRYRSGVSVQWGQGQRVTVWKWDAAGTNNRRLWPGE